MFCGFKAKNHPQTVKSRGADDAVDRGTDLGLFWALNSRFQFTLDAAASKENSLCDLYYSLAENGLLQSWRGERVWCNPPYSNIGPWISKAWDSFHDGTDLIVMLLPANRTEQPFWQKLVEPKRDKGNGFKVEFLAGRIRFRKREGGQIYPGRPPFGCCLLIWERNQ